MTDNDHKQTNESVELDEISISEMLGWCEFGCWTVLVLAPILYWANGPSVSTDQFVVRTTLVILSSIAAPFLRWINWKRANGKTSGDN